MSAKRRTEDRPKFPIEDATSVVSFLRGGGLSRKAIANAIHSLTGFVLTQVDLDVPPLTADLPMGNQEAANELEVALAVGGETKAVLIRWRPLLSLLAFELGKLSL